MLADWHVGTQHAMLFDRDIQAECTGWERVVGNVGLFQKKHCAEGQ